MNNRIRELEPQCWEHNEFGLNFNYEKFAELIVRECAQEFDNTYMSGGKTMGAYIREKFGVEE